MKYIVNCHIMRKIGGLFQLVAFAGASLLVVNSCQTGESTDFPAYQPISFQQVSIQDEFWSAKIDSNHQKGIPGCFEACDYSLVNFDIAAGISDAERQGTEASDSDVYKIIQGAAHALDHHPDPVLENYVDQLIDRIAAAQQADGYLNTYWTIKDLSRRWTMIETRHELYCAGHFFEAATAYYQVTGKRKMLDMAIQLADHIDSVFGPGKLENIPGHQEIELALFNLYEVTGEERYFKLAGYFLEERGNPKRLAYRASLGERDPNFGIPARWLKPSYRQDHIPVKEQRKATGHAVRASYMFAGMADYTRLSKSEVYMPALNALWQDIVNKKIYINGSIGTTEFHDEGFGSEYSLPTDKAYCETCSAIALMLWNYRMASLTGDARFSDLFELTLYNGGLSGGSASGDRFFYVNPLEGHPNHEREAWYEPGCCPSNFVRFVPQIDQFIYGQNENRIYVNQFVGSELTTSVGEEQLLLKQTTAYPWKNTVNLELRLDRKTRINLMIRIPGWARGKFYPGDLYGYSGAQGGSSESTEHRVPSSNKTDPSVILRLNGRNQAIRVNELGYISLDRKWTDGDQVELSFEMPVKLVSANPLVKDVEGQQVLTRGPVLYCLEGIDNQFVMENSKQYGYLDGDFRLAPSDDISRGINFINGYLINRETKDQVGFSAIPYFAWRNRGATEMRVWF